MASKWIWPFELLDKLGEGGMGVVYRARYVGNDRIVAVKLLPDDVAENPTLVARFDRELEILCQLRHKHIVHCFGGATESKQRFYAMELVEGGTLAQALKAKGRFSWDYVVEYGIQICAALQYAHERGVIHRDIKPANFLVTKSGQIKLSDFGLATIVAGQRITMQGKTAGTFLYMAPEQIRGKPPLSNRTDLYALGCVFFELLTGQPPFDAPTPAEVLHKHLKETPPKLSTVLLDCPVELDRLVTDLLQKDPELRPASAQVVEQRLQAILRPSLVQHVDNMARTPTANVPHVVATPSDDDLLTVSDRSEWSQPLVRRLTAAVVVLVLLAGWGWMSAFSASARASAQAQRWVQMALEEGPLQVAALEQLGKNAELSPATFDRLLELVTTGSTPLEVRIAAVRVMREHPELARQHANRLLSLERNEPEMILRQELANTRVDLQDTPVKSRGFAGGWLWRGLVLCAAIAGGWQVWRRWLK